LPTPIGQALPRARSRSAFAVSHRLDGLLHPTVAGLLHPATGQRFIAFHASRDQIPSEDDPELRRHSPRCGFTPLEGSPSSAAVPRHRGRCPPVVSARSTLRRNAPFPPPEVHRRGGFSPSGVSGGSRPARASRENSNRSPPPLVNPARPDPPWIRLLCRDCRSSPAREPGVNRSPPVLVTTRRYRSGSWSTRRRECARLQRLAGLRTAPTQFPRRSSEEEREVVPSEPKLIGGQITEVTQLASSRPTETMGWHLDRCLREQRRTLSMMVMLRSTGVDPHVTTATSRLGVNLIQDASPRNPGHRSGSPGEPGGPLHPGSDHSWPVCFGSASCRDYGVQIDRVSRSATKHSRHPAIRRLPPRWKTTSAGLVLGDPHGSLPTIGFEDPTGRLRPHESPEERPASGLCSADESVTFSNRCRPENALSFHGLCSPPRSSAARRLNDLDACSAPMRSDARFGDTNVPVPHARPVGLPYESSLPRFTDASSCTSIEIE
jgi:hypothetical protein